MNESLSSKYQNLQQEVTVIRYLNLGVRNQYVKFHFRFEYLKIGIHCQKRWYLLKQFFSSKLGLIKCGYTGDLMTRKYIEKLIILHCYNCI